MPIGLTQTTFAAPRTVRNLIEMAYRIAKVIGRGEALDDVTANEGGYLLNDIIEQATIEKIFSSYQTEITFPLVAGQASYTIGPGLAQVVAARPTEILSGYVRRQNIDYPVSLSHSKSDYDGIAIKTLQAGGWSTFVYYQASHPLGTLFLYPVPSDNDSTLTLTVSSETAAYSSLEDEVLLPPTYFAWLQYKLASRIAPDYGQPWSEDNTAILENIEGALVRNNLKPAQRVSVGLSELGHSGGKRGYNINVDR